MKIIRSSRRRTLSLPPPVRVGKKSALLVGINYDSPKYAVEKGYAALKTCRKDTLDFKQLLVDKFGYLEEDITVMTDEPENPELAPTKINVIREIRSLVKDAQSGDRFVFLFAGHSNQIVSDSRSEDDGLDETIVLVDEKESPEEEHIIVDNHLRRLLVDPLPIGAHLTAIFDSCHSGTLLDLKHYTCNQTFHPWVSKGVRRSHSKWEQVLRRDAAMGSIPAIATPPGVRIHQRQRVGRREVVSKDISLEIMPKKAHSIDSQATITVTSRTASLLSQRLVSRNCAEEPTIAQVLANVSNRPENWNACNDVEIPTCLSPVGAEDESCLDDEKAAGLRLRERVLSEAQFVSESPASNQCTGFCVESPSDSSKPYVVSVSACKDQQIAYEDKKGNSITRALIDILNELECPTFRDLMTHISNRIYNKSRRIHRIGHKRHEEEKRGRRANMDPDKPKPFIDVVNFQEPQLGSEQKLNLDTHFVL